MRHQGFHGRLYPLRTLCGIAGLTLLFAAIGCGKTSEAPANKPTEPATYRQAVSLFYTGLRAYETGGPSLPEFNTLAHTSLLEFTKLVPTEPAGWLNLALISQKLLQKTDEALQAIEKAKTLAPNNADVEVLYGFLLEQQGKVPEALPHLRRAVELDGKNSRARYRLVETLLQNPTPEIQNEVQPHLAAILEQQPNNLCVLVYYARNCAERKDSVNLQTTMSKITRLQEPGWGQSATDTFAKIQQGLTAPDVSAIAPLFTQLHNVLRNNSNYFKSLAPFKADVVYEHFYVLAPPPTTPSPADTSLTLQDEPLKDAPSTEKWTYSRTLVLKPEVTEGIAAKFVNYKAIATPEGPQGLLVANGSKVVIANGEGMTLTLPFPGGSKATPPAPEGINSIDFSYDFRPDLVLAGEGGIKFYKQTPDTGFTDVTPSAKLPAATLNRAYRGTWACDIDLDGDLDLILAPTKGDASVLRNSGDGTWVEIKPFPSVRDVQQMTWADMDNDGDQDVIFLTADGKLHAFENLRSGIYRAWKAPTLSVKATAITVSDLDRSGQFQLIVLQEDGKIVALRYSDGKIDWESKDIGQWNGLKVDRTERIFAAELDNNGTFDLITTNLSGFAVWLGDDKGGFTALPTTSKTHSLTLTNDSMEGRLHPISITVDGKPSRLHNRGAKNYHWQDFRPRADYVVRGPIQSAAAGSGRINAFGFGGSLELRASLLYQHALMTEPNLHFGLGENGQTDAIRFVWPNGYVRADFASNLKMDAVQTAPYRPGGSCPWLYAWDGKEMKLVTDCIWRSPLGLRINAQATAGVVQTEDWIKIRGDQLKPRNGYYDLRICAELWETHFFDHLGLMAVDHPKDTDIWIDERFSIPPPPLAVITTRKPVPVSNAVDDNGNDVTNIVNRRDANYLDTFGRGQYQGVTRDHYVEVEIDSATPKTDSLYLIATGWIHPTDSSVNVAISQGNHEPPQGLSLEVPDGKGGWMTAKPGLGFPEGKVKTVVLNLTGIFRPNTPRRVRLRTNLEIYWDYIGTAVGVANAPIEKQMTSLTGAGLQSRGFSQTVTKNVSSPEIGIYNVVAVKPIWLDLEGYYTRFGDVQELLKKTDDRYVIMNAGDEMRLRFSEITPPKAGWERDYVLIGDGWVKDGNFNTTFSKTVMPLPSHSIKNYSNPPTELQNDPVYKKHKQDWKTYHTRYVSPREFYEAMKPTVH